MKLSAEQIKRMVFGASECVVEQDCIRFFRMPQKLLEIIAKNSAVYANRATSTAGIRMDFYTDSEYFEFSYDRVASSSSRNFYDFTLCVDGKFFASTGDSTGRAQSGDYCTALPRGRKRVTLYFPNLYRAEIVGVTLSDGAFIEPMHYCQKALFIGDSITQGCDARKSANSYFNRYVLNSQTDAINFGVSGAWFNDYMIYENAVTAADKVVVALGTNAWWCQNRGDYERDCRRFFDKLMAIAAGKPIYAVLPVWRKEDYSQAFGGSQQEGRELLRAILGDYAVEIIDLWDIMPQDERFYSDGLHPNDEGMRCYANALEQRLKL